MKVKIIIKKEEEISYTDKNGEPKTFFKKSLFVSHTSEEIFKGMQQSLKSKGAELEKIEKFCKPFIKDGKTSYSFNLNCSSFTFDRVDQYGTLDAKIELSVNAKGWCEAKISVIDKKEQVLGYEKPSNSIDEETEGVEGWAIEAPEIEKSEAPQPTAPQSLTELKDFALNQPVEDLPF